MTKNKGKKIKMEFDELTLWKAGTIIFGILFVLCLLKGGDDSGSIAAVPSAAQAPTPSAAPQAPPKPVDIKIGDAIVKGDEDAKVEIIEFSDFQCPYCARFYTQTYGQILENYVETGKAKLAFKHLPLGFHPYAQKASEATECARDVSGDDAFWDMHDKIFENQQSITVPDLKGYATEIGIDQAEFDSCLDNGDTEARVKADLAEASKYGISGTPSFFINGVKVVGAQPYSVFEAAIEAALNE